MKDTWKMSNEELCMFIKAGDKGYLPQLWEQVRNLIALKARRFHSNLKYKNGVEVDDLIQSGYFAVLKAVKYYEPQKGYMFTTYLDKTLKTSFLKTAGLRTSKRNILNYCASLDEPLNEEDNISLLETIQDLSAEDALYDIVEDVYNRELRRLLNTAMNSLGQSARRRVTMHYYFNLTHQEIADIQGVSKAAVELQINTALRRMYYRICNTNLIEFFYGTRQYRKLKRSRARCDKLNIKATQNVEPPQFREVSNNEL